MEPLIDVTAASEGLRKGVLSQPGRQPLRATTSTKFSVLAFVAGAVLGFAPTRNRAICRTATASETAD